MKRVVLCPNFASRTRPSPSRRFPSVPPPRSPHPSRNHLPNVRSTSQSFSAYCSLKISIYTGVDYQTLTTLFHNTSLQPITKLFVSTVKIKSPPQLISWCGIIQHVVSVGRRGIEGNLDRELSK